MMKILVALSLLAVCGVAVSAADSCFTRNASCSHCVDKFECYWCGSNAYVNDSSKSTCMKRKVYNLEADCSGSYYLYPSCKISGLAVMIIVIITCLLFVVLIGCCIYCCCCRSGKSTRLRWAREDSRDRQARSERRDRQDSRRAERKERHDDIRKKYGLYKDDQQTGTGTGTGTDGRYQRFDV